MRYLIVIEKGLMCATQHKLQSFRVNGHASGSLRELKVSILNYPLSVTCSVKLITLYSPGKFHFEMEMSRNEIN